MGLRDWLTGARAQPDRFSLPADHPLRAEHEMISALMREAAERGVEFYRDLATLDAYRAIVASDAETAVRIVRAATERVEEWHKAWRSGVPATHLYLMALPSGVITAIARRRFLANPTGVGSSNSLSPSRAPGFPWPPRERAALLDLIQDWSLLRALLPDEGSPIPDELRAALTRLRQRLPAGGRGTAKRIRALMVAVDDLLSADKRAVFDPGEPWTAAPEAELARGPWTAWGRHLLDADSTKLSKKWKDEAVRLIAAIGAEAVRSSGSAWLTAACGGSQPAVSPRNGNFLRGLVWCLARDGSAESARRVGDVAIAMSRKIPNVGMRSVKVLNGCVALLGEMDDPEAMAQLTRLRLKIKAPPTQGLIARAMSATAERRGMSTADLEELVVPTFGMDATGCLRQGFGAYSAELRIASSDRVELAWRTAAGSVQKSVPADVKRDHAEGLAALKRVVRDVGAMLPVQRERIEQLLLAERVLPFGAWRERYADHPVVGQFARRLIWHFEDGVRSAVGAFDGDAILDVSDHPIDWLGAESAARVRLWHPIGFPAEVIEGWRRWLERHEVVQPFKQAHREIYILTDAELATRTYSNRFASHIVRQHQFAALCKARGWRYRLQGAFDGANNPVLVLPARGLSVEYFVMPCESETGMEAIAPYASTDQVRFVNEAGETQELIEIPALVFSEVMRDVDLFVGVSSVGADPTWTDSGHREEWNGYWRSFAFGDLSQTAETRRAVIERLLPKLAIAPRARVDGKFLVVRGDIRTYKIHLGSGNILMEPNDQYLCIVPERKGAPHLTGRVWVPFEGDGTLSVILSKAFLLAADRKITDPTILRQIGV